MGRVRHLELSETELLQHRAVIAWEKMCQPANAIRSVEVLKQKKRAKSLVYRLHGAGADGKAVIAKRCRESTGSVEIWVYGSLLRDLKLDAITLYGSVPDADAGRRWLFLEDAGTQELADGDLAAVVRWLAHFHFRARNAPEFAGIVSQSAIDYRHELERSLQALEDAARSGRFENGAGSVVRRTVRLLETVGIRSHDIDASARRMPRTLLHGDVTRKNVRVRRNADQTRVLILDWECARYGSPGTDLAALSWGGTVETDRLIRNEYLAVAGPAYGLTVSDLNEMLVFGKLLRCIERSSINATSLNAGPKPWFVERLQFVERHLEESLSELGWH